MAGGGMCMYGVVISVRFPTSWVDGPVLLHFRLDGCESQGDMGHRATLRGLATGAENRL